MVKRCFLYCKFQERQTLTDDLGVIQTASPSHSVRRQLTVIALESNGSKSLVVQMSPTMLDDFIR